jgi:hypothetical protein
MKTNILYYVLFAIMFVMTVSGEFICINAVKYQYSRFIVANTSHSHHVRACHLFKGEETDPSDDSDVEDFDLEELEPDDADVRYLLRETNVEKALNREIQRTHDDYHHVDIAGVDGIEVFCPESARNNRNIKQLQTELRKAANKKGNKKTQRCGRGTFDQRCHEDYHLIKLFSCQIYCPEYICPN